MIHCCTIPPAVNPEIRPALDALAETLTDRHYSAHAATSILAYVAAEGTLAGALGLEQEDEAAAEAAFVDALPAVSFDSLDWGSLEDLEDIDAIIEGPNRIPLGPGRILFGSDDYGHDPAEPTDGGPAPPSSEPEYPTDPDDEPEMPHLDPDDQPDLTEDLEAEYEEAIEALESLDPGPPPTEDPGEWPKPIRGASPEADLDDPMGFPRLKNAFDRHQDQADVIRFYRDHPEPPTAA